jgi:ABC-type antimicrobial peptide transport system permease subunit
VHELDKNIALADVRTMEERLSETAALPRLNALLLTALAVVALLIGSIGIYGILAYSVGQRRSEIGVRMALGATRGRVWRLILYDGLRVALVGLSTGLLGALVFSEAVSSLVFQVNVTDPLIFSAAAVALAGAAFMASSIPALRAARVDPGVALRQE